VVDNVPGHAGTPMTHTPYRSGFGFTL
jgi:hypothetical protein